MNGITVSASKESFDAGTEPVSIRFVRDDKGKVTGYKVTGFRARNLHFSKIG